VLPSTPIAYGKLIAACCTIRQRLFIQIAFCSVTSRSCYLPSISELPNGVNVLTCRAAKANLQPLPSNKADVGREMSPSDGYLPGAALVRYRRGHSTIPAAMAIVELRLLRYSDCCSIPRRHLLTQTKQRTGCYQDIYQDWKEVGTILPSTVTQTTRPDLQRLVKMFHESSYIHVQDASLSLQSQRQKQQLADLQHSTAANACRFPGTEPSYCTARAFDWREEPKIRD
jgi:hypothetical protein